MKDRQMREPVPCSILRTSSTEAEQAIEEQLETGRQIRDRILRSDSDLARARSEQARWSATNSALMGRLFVEVHFQNAYDRAITVKTSPRPPACDASRDDMRHHFAQRMNHRLSELEGVLTRLHLCHKGPSGQQ